MIQLLSIISASQISGEPQNGDYNTRPDQARQDTPLPETRLEAKQAPEVSLRGTSRTLASRDRSPGKARVLARMRMGGCNEAIFGIS